MLDVTFGGTRNREPLAAIVEKFGSATAPAVGRFTMGDMWEAANDELQNPREEELMLMLIECLNRIEQARDVLNHIVNNRAFVGTFAQDVARNAQWFLDGEPDGADA